MNKKKHTGSYYTPEYLADFIMAYVSPHFKGLKKISILEPSCGDGSFIRSFNKTKFPKSVQNITFQAVEKIKPELRKAREQAQINRKDNVRFTFIKNDFLKFQSTATRRYSFIAGNPPYIKKSLLNQTQIGLCESIHESAGLSINSVKNIWTYFLIRSCELLSEDGVLAFVLPAELLQVKFSVELRQYLINNFARTEIFTFDDLLFECKGQDTVLLIAYKQHRETGQYFTHISNVDELLTQSFVLAENKALETGEIKWTHHSITADELEFIYKIGNQLKRIDSYCDSKPGIVTAANDFFIVNEKTAKDYDLSEFLKPIIQKGYFVNGSVVFDRKEFENLVNEGKPTKVLAISDTQAKNLPGSVSNYLKIGVDKELQLGYKCSKRINWFVIPNISDASDGFFFRRIHHYPKLLKNEANVLVTDSAYKVEMRDGFEINDLIFSFYNSLTLAFTELFGRYYGGGVLELTPQEFKKLPTPFLNISNSEFNSFRKAFEGKSSINEILIANDFEILNTALKLSLEDIQKLQLIREKLVSKRFRR